MSDLSLHSAGFNSESEEEQLQQSNLEVKEEVVEILPQSLETRNDSEDDEDLDNQTLENSPEYLDYMMSEIKIKVESRNSVPSLLRARTRINKVFPLIRQFGLQAEHLNFVFSLVMNLKLSQSQARAYVPFLLPRDQVPEMMIIRIIALLSRRKDEFNLLNDLLIWSITVFELVDSTERIKKYYDILFRHLNSEITRDATCHLLYFLTRAANVIPYNIRKLNQLVAQEKQNAALIGLLTVYASFNPEIEVTPNIRAKNLYIFEHPDPEMKHDLTNIRVYWGNHLDEADLDLHKPQIAYPDVKRLRKQKEMGRKRNKRSKTDNTDDLIDQVSFKSAIDIEMKLKELAQLPYSQQLTRVLDDRAYQHLLVINPDPLAITRLGHWLGQKLLDLVRYSNSADKGKQELKELIGKMLIFTRFAKAQLPIIEEFLKEYLKSWNGIEFQDEIFELITYVKPADYKYLYLNILLPLYRKYYVMDVFWKAKLIMGYTDWLTNWALLNWQGHTKLSKEHENEDQSTTDDEEVDKVTWLFEGLSFNIDYFGTIQRFIEHVDRICVMGLLAEGDHPFLQHASLSFFELVSTITLQHDIPEIIIPAANFVHRSFFSSNAMAMSRICGILCQYKKAFLENDNKPKAWMSKHSNEYLNHFNTYVMDICNSLWRNMHLSKAGKTAIAFALTDESIEKFTKICEERGDNVNLALSLTHSSALAGFSKRFMTKLEGHVNSQVAHNEPITEEYLKRLEEQGGMSISYLEYRVEFLNYLYDMGLTGIHDLLYACMTTLINIKQGTAAGSTRNSIGSVATTGRNSTESQNSTRSHRSGKSSASRNSKIE